MLGQDLVGTHMVDAEHTLALARIRQVESLPLGQALPAAELRMRARDGHLISVRSIGASNAHAGRPAVLSITLDETEQRAASLALARSQALLASVVSLSPDIITLTELQTGRYVMVNDSFCRLLGYDRAEVVGRTSADIGLWHHLADRERVVQTIAAQDMVQDELIHFVTRSGRLLPLLVSCARVENEGKPYLLLNARDMSEANRVRLEREAILANASVGIAFTRNRHFVLANAQFEQMYGWPAGALTGQPGQAVFIDAADYEALGRDISPALQRGDVADIERQAHRRDGSPFLVRLRAKAIDPTNPTENGTIWITEDVTGARQAEQDLARARDAAEAANRAKSAFLANTSHEIRTPLHGVLGLARLARQPGLAPERQRQMLDQISESAELLAVIISDILDVAKVEAGKLQLESAPFNLHGLLDSLRHDFSALAAGHGLVFDAGFDPALPVWVRGDALRVRQIVANFLHNALKFTASGGIRLQAIALPDERVRFEVHDTGPGIPPATQARLFEPFTQADTSTTRRYGGTGLGLSISRELATLMGGSVGLSSTTGRGSCFHAELPLPAVQAGADTETASAADSLRLRGARVLLVEDNSVNMMIGVALLEQWGVAVTEAVDGRQALEAIAQASAAGRRFDAVLMDVQMPGMSGYEATQILRQHHGADQLPVIALTAAALVSERTHALAIGMNDFLTKPIDPTRLQAALLRALADPAPATPGPAA
jgi:PAS domain S-box-containing protein